MFSVAVAQLLVVRRFMRVRGFTLPKEFVSCVETGQLRRSRGSWPLRGNRDAFGNHWESELGEIYSTVEDIQRESDLLPRYFSPDIRDVPEMFADAPGFIPYISDFSRILTFAISGDGAPFCFDYREDDRQPSIIWWDDAYWRCVSPDFTKFLSLFDVTQNA
jgi:hypothetical protein